MNRTKKIISVIVCVVALIAAFSMVAYADKPSTHHVTTAAELAEVLENIENYKGETVIIEKDIDMSSYADKFTKDLDKSGVSFFTDEKDEKYNYKITGLNIAPFKITAGIYEGVYRTKQLLAPVDASGWFTNEDGKYLYMDKGFAKTGWAQIDGSYYYLDPANKGLASIGWDEIDGSHYYFNQWGKMVTGWTYIDGNWYYFNQWGKMVNGWNQISNKWYYFNQWGKMVKGWASISGKWYYFNNSGAMVTGWAQISNKWYYFNNGGAMVTGWAQLGGKWYYFNNSGAMLTGWQQIGGKWYYFNNSGAMLTGTQRIGGKTYRFNSSGAWVA